MCPWVGGAVPVTGFPTPEAWGGPLSQAGPVFAPWGCPEAWAHRWGPAVRRKGGFLEVPLPPLPHPRQLCSWKLKELGCNVYCGLSRKPVIGSYPPREGSALLADRISVPA